jgi:hypothetical protein
MNKPALIFTLCCLLVFLVGCKSGKTWEDETLQEVSQRLLSEDVKAVWNVEHAAPDQTSRIRLRLRKLDGMPIERFSLNHEKLLHLMIVSKDLSYFQHIHPEYVGDGTFEIDNHFPAGGDYKLIADFKPAEGDAMIKTEWVNVPGPAAPFQPITSNAQMVSKAGGARVKLDIDKLSAKSDALLTFTLHDDASGEPITDLEPYLGAIGHVVILSKDAERYIHVHAEEGQRSGPQAIFEAVFPSPGLYKIWGQFQRGGQVLTVDFVIEATPRAAAG